MRRNFIFAGVLASLAALCSQAHAVIHYEVKTDVPHRLFLMSMDFTAPAGKTTFSIPAWSPGYYQIANYQKNVSLVNAVVGGMTIQAAYDGSRSWTVVLPKAGDVHVTYEIQANDPGLGFFGSHIDSFTGFINGASAFMYVQGRETEADTLKVVPPAGWSLSCPLAQTSPDSFTAETGYDEMIDSPIQMGQFLTKSFTVSGIPFEAVFVTGGDPVQCNVESVVSMLQKVSAPAIQMFGGAPFKKYTYYLHLKVGNFAGGLEHRNSTVICLPDSPSLSFPDIAAHENFHAWNVKQIRPFELGPFDYSKTADTSQIWFSEGVTDYYADLLTYRSGLVDAGWLNNEITQRIDDLQNSPARHRISLAQCGADTWSADGFSDKGLNFYTKGYLVGWLLDAGIRGQTGGKKSLDDVMRLMFKEYRLPNPGFKAGGILKAVDEVIGKPGAMDIVYSRMVHSTEEMPYSMVRSIGFQVVGPDLPQIGFGFKTVNGLVTDADSQCLAVGLQDGDKVDSIATYPWAGGSSENQNFYTVNIERTVDGKQVKKSYRLPFNYSAVDDFAVIPDPTANSQSETLRTEWLSRPQSESPDSVKK